MHFSGGTYTTRTHDSLKISNGRWMWWSRGIGGRSALDYLIKVRGIPFVEAVEMLAGRGVVQPPELGPALKMEKKLLLPAPNHSHTRVISYLRSRGIDPELIDFCLETGRIYESRHHHNAVFVGLDGEGKPRYGALRGTGTDFIGDASGSDKHYSFSLPAEKMSSEVHLFESAIDLLSFATLMKLEGKDWRKTHLLSLAGVYRPSREPGRSKVPAALSRFLNEHSEVRLIVLHLDNDRAGRLAAEAVQTAFQGQDRQYKTMDLPPEGKDYNDHLCLRLGIRPTQRAKRGRERREER